MKIHSACIKCVANGDCKFQAQDKVEICGLVEDYEWLCAQLEEAKKVADKILSHDIDDEC